MGTQNNPVDVIENNQISIFKSPDKYSQLGLVVGIQSETEVLLRHILFLEQLTMIFLIRLGIVIKIYKAAFICF